MKSPKSVWNRGFIRQICRLTRTLTGRGERMRASGPVEREVRRSDDMISPQSKQTGSMEDGHNLDKVGPDAIDDSVVTVNHLANRLVANLRDDAPGQRVGPQTFHRRNKPFNEKIGVPRRVASHIGPYCFNVLDGLR